MILKKYFAVRDERMGGSLQSCVSYFNRPQGTTMNRLGYAAVAEGRSKVYDLFNPAPSRLGELYDGVRFRSVGNHVVSMGYATSGVRDQSNETLVYACATVVFHRRGHREFDYRGGDRAGLCKAVDGQVSLLPAGVALQVRYHEPCEGLVMGLSNGLIDNVARELGVYGQIPLSAGLDDPALTAIAELFWSSRANSPRFVDSLGKAMLIHILEKYRLTAKQDPSTPTWLKSTRLYIHKNLERKISLEDLAEAAGLSRAHFARSFKHATGLTPLAFVAQQRAERARELMLNDQELTLSRVATAVGFCDQSHLTTHFRRRFGITPAAFRRN